MAKDLLRIGSAWLEAKRNAFASSPVTYQRGAKQAEVLATVGRTVWQVQDEAGLLINVESRDFLISAADLVLESSRIEPRKGDRIVEVQGANTYVYEVLAPGNEPVWRYSDPYRQTYRIHTKQVKAT